MSSGEVTTNVSENGISSYRVTGLVFSRSPKKSKPVNIARRHRQKLLLNNFHLIYSSSWKSSISPDAINVHFFDSKTPLNVEGIIPIITKESTGKFLLTS